MEDISVSTTYCLCSAFIKAETVFFLPLPSVAKINCTIPLDMIHDNPDARRYMISASIVSWNLINQRNE